MTIATCQTCRFRSPDGRAAYRETSGYCRRFPPQIIFHGSRPGSSIPGLVEQHSPWVGPSDWCGEWKEKR